ncbi:NADP-dependent oxidoreductase [Albimonas sp. CAU 1670]|uniref:NADP-dependent oxidoreductase n=1 Tax=Albimonas sp. CAU 1670 TaxID=3032599 RepID=UPI0023DA5F10|nr:NADP-dependent oxidoreductase [Albimonas sp. CAU 1670]MDF2231686.1 NADP-dependent oxidoreductase [Albimonas sp. CAU 1670]
MRKISQSATGGPEVLELIEAPDPVPATGEALVAVAAASINPVDIAFREGLFPMLPDLPFTVGWDVAGTVAAVGEGEAPFAPGTRVFGMPRFPKEAGGYASMIAAPAAELAATPEAWSDVQAAAVPLAGLTAWQGLVKAGKIQAGQRVLITAAAGGVGHLAVQIAAAFGAETTASASAAKHDRLREWGAVETLDYASEPADAKGARFDLIFDAFGGETTEALLPALVPGGTIVSLRDPSAGTRERAEAEGKTLRRIGVRPNGEQLAELARLGAEGKLTPEVARTFPLAEAGAAQTWLKEARPVGKVVLIP